MFIDFVFIFLVKHIFLPDVSGCDVNLTVTDTIQYFATEGYPYSYKRNQSCTFNFNAPAGRKIILLCLKSSIWRMDSILYNSVSNNH